MERDIIWSSPMGGDDAKDMEGTVGDEEQGPSMCLMGTLYTSRYPFPAWDAADDGDIMDGRVGVGEKTVGKVDER